MSRGTPIYYNSCQSSTVASAMTLAVWRCASLKWLQVDHNTILGFYKCLIDMKYSTAGRDNL